ncbi:hypothetical protein ACJX0J_007937, partial [Zea mays]
MRKTCEPNIFINVEENTIAAFRNALSNNLYMSVSNFIVLNCLFFMTKATCFMLDCVVYFKAMRKTCHQGSYTNVSIMHAHNLDKCLMKSDHLRAWNQTCFVFLVTRVIDLAMEIGSKIEKHITLDLILILLLRELF